jgi:hypothetical protein
MSSAQNVTAAAAVMPVTQQRAGKKKQEEVFLKMTASDAVEGGV